MIIKKKLKEGVWCKYKDKVEFQIRLFKFSKLKITAIDNITEGLAEKFCYCLVDWKGVFDEDNKTEFKCTPENKNYIYDYYEEVREFIFEKIKAQQDKLEKSIKN